MDYIDPPEIGEIRNFPQNARIAGFSEKTYAFSLLKAHEWAAGFQKELCEAAKMNVKVTLTGYFKQVAFHKSILVSYVISKSDVGV